MPSGLYLGVMAGVLFLFFCIDFLVFALIMPLSAKTSVSLAPWGNYNSESEKYNPTKQTDLNMATLKIKLRASALADKEGTLFYQVIHCRIVRQINTHRKLFPQEWDAERMEIVVPSGIDESRRAYLACMREILTAEVTQIEQIVEDFDRAGEPYVADAVADAFLALTRGDGFIGFGQSVVDSLIDIGKKRIAETYSAAVNSFRRFRAGRDVPIDEVDGDMMAAYESFLSSTGVCLNTVSFYMRNLRAIYNRAVEKKQTSQRYPFKHVYTGIDKTVKRAVPLDIIRMIRDVNLSSCPAMDYARDLFMFSFYMRGMSFVDLAFLKKTNLQHGLLSYRRHKTNQLLSVKWERPMQAIIDKYDTSGTPYLLPVIKANGKDERRQYINGAHRVNRNLKRLGVQLGLPIPLTTYVARHAWASIARSKNVAVSIISEAMGHDSESTTRIYLASLDTSAVDKANSLILKSL